MFFELRIMQNAMTGKWKKDIRKDVLFLYSRMHSCMLWCQLPAQFINTPADIMRSHYCLQRNLLNLSFTISRQKKLKTVFLKSGEHEQFRHLPCKWSISCFPTAAGYVAHRTPNSSFPSFSVSMRHSMPNRWHSFLIFCCFSISLQCISRIEVFCMSSSSF